MALPSGTTWMLKEKHFLVSSTGNVYVSKEIRNVGSRKRPKEPNQGCYWVLSKWSHWELVLLLSLDRKSPLNRVDTDNENIHLQLQNYNICNQLGFLHNFQIS